MLGRYPTSATEADEAERAAAKLDTKADPEWVAGCVYTLLMEYYVKELPEHVAAMQAKRWFAELKSYPAWAIDAACIWWLSKNNPKRGKKPVPGDISARCDVEVAIIKLARTAADTYRKYGDNPPSWVKR